MQFDFAEIRENAIFTKNVREKLIQIILNRVDTERHNLKSLCCSLTFFVMHTHRDWDSFIADLVRIFSEGNDLKKTCVLIRIFDSLAYDQDDRKLVIEDSLRKSYSGCLQLSTMEIFQQLQTWAAYVNRVTIEQPEQDLAVLQFQEVLIYAT